MELCGIDINKGKNVDIPVTNPYLWPFEDNTFDLIISGQTLEHVGNPFLWIKELYRVLKEGGEVFIIAPSKGKQHCPPDYWRILPDGMKALLQEVGFEDIVVTLDKKSPWGDCCGFGRKK